MSAVPVRSVAVIFLLLFATPRALGEVQMQPAGSMQGSGPSGPSPAFEARIVTPGPGSSVSQGALTSLGASTVGGVPPYDLSWNFGDNASQIGKGNNVSHVFSHPGRFLVIVNAMDAAGSTSTASQTLDVIASGPSVEPTIDATRQVVELSAVAEPVVFSIDTDLLPPLNFTWSFGDGNDAFVASPQHSYRAAGNYLVTLNLTKSESSRPISFVTSTNVLVALPSTDLAPILQFTSLSVALDTCPFSWIANFTVHSADLTYPASAQWEFGDGSGSLHPNTTSHQYLANNSVVNLTEIGANGFAGTFSGIVHGPPPSPNTPCHAGFSLDSAVRSLLLSWPALGLAAGCLVVTLGLSFRHLSTKKNSPGKRSTKGRQG